MDNDWEKDLYKNSKVKQKKEVAEEIEVEVGDMMSSIEKYLQDIRGELTRGRQTMAGIAFVFMMILLFQECSG